MVNNAVQKQFEGFLQSNSLLLESSIVLPFEQFVLKKKRPLKNLDLVITDNLMLGKRVEYFFKHYLENYTEFSISKENIQIFKGTRTLGELDYILQKNKQSYHIELAYKFYLYNPNQSTEELENWIGPNKKDALLTKVDKLKHKQFPLLKTEEAIEALELPIETHKNILQQQCVLGQLFIPKDYMNYVFKEIDPQAIVGYYESYTVFLNTNHSDYYYYIPSKQNWLVPPELHTNWLTYEAINNELKENMAQKKATLLWSKHIRGKTSSLFITWW